MKKKQYNIHLTFCEGENNSVQFWQWNNDEGVVYFHESVYQKDLYIRSRGFLRNNVPVITECNCAAHDTHKQLNFKADYDADYNITDFKISRKLK